MKILIDNGHGSDTKGKCSPDGKLREYAWARACSAQLLEALRLKGYNAELVTPEAWDVPLQTRVNRVNEMCKAYGAKNCLLVSVHNNAAGTDGKWHDACGFSVFVSKNASSNSKKMASLFTEEARKRNLLGNRSVPQNKYWTWSWTNKDIYILKATSCPAVLTENMFQDNKGDVEFLLSDDGLNTIVDLHVNAIINYIYSMS